MLCNHLCVGLHTEDRFALVLYGIVTYCLLYYIIPSPGKKSMLFIEYSVQYQNNTETLCAHMLLMYFFIDSVFKRKCVI